MAMRFYVLSAYDHGSIPFFIALREHLITKGVSPTSIVIVAEFVGDGTALRDLYNVSTVSIDIILASIPKSYDEVEIISSDTHIIRPEYSQFVQSVDSFSAASNCQIIVSFVPDGSANRPSNIPQEDLINIFKAGQSLLIGYYYSFGYSSSVAIEKRSLFTHEHVSFIYLRCFLNGSRLATKSPYKELAHRIIDYCNNNHHVLWIPLRAICNDNAYHDGAYDFGGPNKFHSTCQIYRRLIEIFQIHAESLRGSPIVLVGDYRTNHSLGLPSQSDLKNAFGLDLLYIQQPQEVRFDFLLGSVSYYRDIINNYIITGDSTTAITVAHGGFSWKEIIFGYEKESYVASGASDWQWQFVSNRSSQWRKDLHSNMSGKDLSAIAICEKIVGDSLCIVKNKSTKSAFF